jgi:hypothetical protein
MAWWRVSEERVLRRVSVPMKEEVTGSLEKICSEELDDLYCSPDVARAMKLRINWLECITPWVGFVWEN